MGKKDDIEELINLMSVALRHKIGSVVNKDDFYAERYAKDSENLMKEAEKVLERRNWNREDKTRIKGKLREKLFKELEEKDFLDNKKFDIMDGEMKKALGRFDLWTD